MSNRFALAFLQFKERSLVVNTRDCGSLAGGGMFSFFTFYLLPVALLLSSCAAWDVGSNVQRGRYTLFRGDATSAAGDFQRATEMDPNYTIGIGPMKEGVWTYLGRAQYTSGDYKSAIKSLERARTSHPNDPFAPLYLGLAQAKDGDRQSAVKELHAGLTGLNDWLAYITQYSADQDYWDPGGAIRSAIKNELARLDSKEINWTDLIASAEYIGIQVEREPEKVNFDKRQDSKNSDSGGRN